MTSHEETWILRIDLPLMSSMTSNNSLSLKQGVLTCGIQAFDQWCSGPLLAPESQISIQHLSYLKRKL